MKLSVLFLASLCAVSANAQYFSAGWTPGAPISDEPPVPTGAPATPEQQPSHEGNTRSSLSSLFNINFEKLAQSGPVSTVFNKIGINITERIEKVKQAADFWDHRVPLITDDNFNELIVNEELTPEEEISRVWFVVMYVLCLI